MRTMIIAGAVLLMLSSVVLGQDTTQVLDLKTFDRLPPVYTQIYLTGKEAEAATQQTGFQLVTKEQKAVNLFDTLKKESKEGGFGMTDPATRAIYVVGAVDLSTYWYIEIPFPSYLKDPDGGTIRLIMQHEIVANDELRIIDEHIATEFDNDTYGRRGRGFGRYGWTRQSGGGDYSWILGDQTAHNLADPWGWAWIVDYRWGQGNSVLPFDVIRIYSHPHVTTRVIIKD